MTLVLTVGKAAGIAVIDRRRNRLALGQIPDSPLSVLDHLAQLGKLGREIDDAEGGLAAAIDIAAVDGPVVVEELKVLLLNGRVEGVQVALERLAGAPNSAWSMIGASRL